jgi:hypothetical protein
MKKGMTCGEAILDPTTNIAKAAAATAQARNERIAKAQKIVAREGISLFDALLKVGI